jgi:hypothetical protein
MSISNILAENKKAWLNANVQDLNVEQDMIVGNIAVDNDLTVVGDTDLQNDVIIGNDLDVTNQTTTDSLIVTNQITTDSINVTNFTIGAIESNNTVPTVDNESNITGFTSARAHAKKINNIVFVNLNVQFDTGALGSASFKIDKANLPIAKTSDFINDDDVIGTGTFENGGAFTPVFCRIGAGAPNRIVFQFANAGVQLGEVCQVNFSYTTD